MYLNNSFINSSLFVIFLSISNGIICSASSNPASITYTGRPNVSGNKLSTLSLKGAIGSTAINTNRSNYFKIKYSLTASSGNWRHKDASLPKFSNTSSSESSCTNSLYDSYSTTTTYHDMKIQILNIEISGTGTNTAIVTADVLIEEMGTKDVTMTIDLDPALDTV